MRSNAPGVAVQSRTSTNLSVGFSNPNTITSSESLNQEANAKLTATKEFEIEFGELFVLWFTLFFTRLKLVNPICIRVMSVSNMSHLFFYVPHIS
ncbi:hypothetical protein PHET_08132 [Paragonimus heterotremus]|uniref:Uncharacterized protein n=1 Tax=Paragonimus heterotremus TaxID=100268 RepID=A0A8J4SWX5_9TREM|nr:hypothetical protein PHET_08132 [Paragonimus heterotremus]